jgi:hypothetical protein
MMGCRVPLRASCGKNYQGLALFCKNWSTENDSCVRIDKATQCIHG